MTTVYVSKRIDKPECRAKALILADKWQKLLQAENRSGSYRIVHGYDRACKPAHEQASYNGGLYIEACRGEDAAEGREGSAVDCLVFITKKRRNRRSFVGAIGVDVSALNKDWLGTCQCAGKHHR